MKNTENINLEGIKIQDGILRVIKDFKQGTLLESNYIQTKHQVSNDMLEHSDFDVIEISKREMMQRVALELLEKYKNSFEETITPFGKEFSLSMLVMSTHELKHIVDYCIRTMPESAIQEIRK